MEGVPTMKLEEIADLLDQIKGATFASLDSETMPKKGVRCVTVGVSVMLFTNKTGSAYDRMVRRRLVAAGKNPDDFVLSDLPWGTRVPESPLIEHNGNYYLQCVVLRPGDSEFFVGRHRVDPLAFGIRPQRTNQGLEEGKEVIVNTIALHSITRLTIMGTRVEGGVGREILKLKH
jgi:hypothetical protein